MCTSIKDEYADAAAAQGANYRGACITYAKTILLLTGSAKFCLNLLYINILESIFRLSLHETKPAESISKNFISESGWAITGVLLGLCACAYRNCV
jgi:hypothetical protein